MNGESVAEITVELEPDTEELVQGEPGVISLNQFVADFGAGLLEAVNQQNPPVFDGTPDPQRAAIMQSLKRKPFEAQQDVVQAVTRLLVDHGDPAAIINAEMGTGKTMMAICAAAVMHAEGYRRCIVISPPHLVYKWRREILDTVPNARVWILNGNDTLRKLLQLRSVLDTSTAIGPEFFILGRVRMRMGFHWKAAIAVRKVHRRRWTDTSKEGDPGTPSLVMTTNVAACPRCGNVVTDSEGEVIDAAQFPAHFDDRRKKCANEKCNEALWTLMRPGAPKDHDGMVTDALCQIPTIGPVTAKRLTRVFGAEVLSGMLADNVHEFVNLMDEDGELVFPDRQAQRMERAMGTLEFAFGQGGYQPTEFIKRYLPDGYFDLLVVDEGHEYKNEGSAQGQAMAVLAAKTRKTLLLTGTLMGGYADDLFFLLWRIMPQKMIEDGFRYHRGGLGAASMGFMREHGILIDVFKEVEEGSHKTARGKRTSVNTKKGPGFGPKGIARYVLPFTAFLKLKQIKGAVLPAYVEHFIEVPMSEVQAQRYDDLAGKLKSEMRLALRRGDKSLLGVVLNVLLAWPDCCFREEVVKHPRSRQLLAFVPTIFDATEVSPKEEELIDLCRRERARNRKVLVYTIYTGTRDMTPRLKRMLETNGFKTAVLRSSVDTSRREDWIMEQVDRGVEVMITNPELVKTGLDLLDFPTIVFMTTGYNVYTLQQASRRSWRIGQKQDVDVYFLGYADTAQITCLTLMAKKIAVSQSTSGDMPDTGLDVLNQDGDSIEVALAKQLMA